MLRVFHADLLGFRQTILRRVILQTQARLADDRAPRLLHDGEHPAAVSAQEDLHQAVRDQLV
jgi:hypothetical protein